MAEIIRCDGGCGAESPDPKTKLHIANSWMNIIVSPENNGRWKRHRLCPGCAKKNVFLVASNGLSVSNSGFASDVLR